MSADRLKIALLTASLPGRYFPERHGVFEAARKALHHLAQHEVVDLQYDEGVMSDRASAQDSIARAKGADFLLVLHGGFTMGDVAKTLAESAFRLGFWAVPEPNYIGDIQLNNFVSLNMSLSIAAITRDTNKYPVAWYYGAPDCKAFRDRLSTTIRALKLEKALTNKSIGLIGGVAPTFYNMEVNAAELMETWGTRVECFSVDQLRRLASERADDEVRREIKEMTAAALVVGVTDSHMELSARYALALRDIAATNSLAALAVSDWPALQENPGFHPGAAFSWLEDRYSLPVASEGDVLGALTQLAAVPLSGSTGCIVDLCAPDLETGRLLVWHGGGGPLHLASKLRSRWVNHPMIGRDEFHSSEIGAIADFAFAPGEITLVRIGSNGRTIFALEANVVETDTPGFTGARGWIDEFKQLDRGFNLLDVIETVMLHGLEHHFIVIPGRSSAVFAELSSWCGAEFVPVSRYRNHLTTGFCGQRYNRCSKWT